MCLAVSGTDAILNMESNYDSLQYFLTSCTVDVSTPVESDLQTTAQCSDIHATAVANVLAANGHYHVNDLLKRPNAPTTLPTYGLNDGDTAATMLANARDVDALITDEFAGTSFALIHAALTEPRIVPAPRLAYDDAKAEHITVAEACQLPSIMSQHRSWTNNAYVQQLLKTL